MTQSVLVGLFVAVSIPLHGLAWAMPPLNFNNFELYGNGASYSEAAKSPSLIGQLHRHSAAGTQEVDEKSKLFEMADPGLSLPVIKASHGRRDLSGKRGKTRGSMPRRGGCAKIFKRYVSAAGHSAYVESVVVSQATWDQMYICLSILNQPTKAAAESAAIAACQNQRKYKGARKKCVVKASK